MSKIPRPFLPAMLVLALAAGAATARERPPADAKPLSQILTTVAQGHPGVIISAEFDDRRWDVVSCGDDGRNCRELRVDPRSGKTLRERHERNADPRPPAGAKTAAQIAHAVEQRQIGTITEIEFEHGLWEVSLRGEDVRAKLYVDPTSGDIQRCRGRGCPAR